MRSPSQATHTSPVSSASEAFATVRRTSRPRRWLLAVVVALIPGWIGSQLFATWIAGAVIAGAVTIGLLAWDHRSGIVTGWRPGDGGQAALLAAAARLEKSGWYALWQPSIRETEASPDLLLVGPRGVVAVGRQVWGFADRVTTDAESRETFVRGQPAGHRVREIRASAAAIREAFSDHHGHDVRVQPVVAVRGLTLANQRSVLPRTVLGVTILPIADLVDHLTVPGPAVNEADAAELARTAQQLFDPNLSSKP